MNFLQGVQRLKRESGRTGDPITTVASLSEDGQFLADSVAEAWLELQRRPHGWAWMRREMVGATVANVPSYTAAALNVAVTDFGHWLAPATEGYQVMVATAAAPTSLWSLRWLPWEVFRLRFNLAAAAPGPATFYSIGPDDKLWIGPTPTEVLTLWASYQHAPLALAVDADVPNIPTEYHMVNVWRALMEVASFDAAPEVYSRAATNFTNIDTDLRARYAPQIGFAQVSLR